MIFLWQRVCWSASLCSMVRYLLIFTWNFSPHVMFSSASGESGSSSSVFFWRRWSLSYIYLSCISISQFFGCNLLGLSLVEAIPFLCHPCHAAELVFRSHVFDLRWVKEGWALHSMFKVLVHHGFIEGKNGWVFVCLPTNTKLLFCLFFFNLYWMLNCYFHSYLQLQDLFLAC